MIRLIGADLIAGGRIWIGVFGITLVSGFLAGIAAGFIETGLEQRGAAGRFLQGASSMVLIFSGLTAVVVLSGTANLAVALHRRTHALWILVGMRPVWVSGVVIAQLVCVSVLGGAVGASLASPAVDPFMRWVFADVSLLEGVHAGVSQGSMAIVIAAVVAVSVLGGLRSARRAAQTPPIAALQSPVAPRASFGWIRVLTCCGLLVALGAVAHELFHGSDKFTPGFLITPLVAGALASMGPVYYPTLVKMWTAIIPARASTTWYLARNFAQANISRSSAAIGPFMVAAAMTAGIYTMLATFAAAAQRSGTGGNFSFTVENFVLVLGGPLLLAIVAAASTVLMSGDARERELALLRAAGGTSAVILLTAVWEAVIYIFTAAMLAAFAAAVGGCAIAAAVSLDRPVIVLTAMVPLTGFGLMLVLTSVLVPSLRSLGRPVPAALAAE